MIPALSLPVREASVSVIPGVYMLVLRDEVVYVGQSTDVQQRIVSHISDMKSGRGGSKEFDRALWIETPFDERCRFERVLMRALRPRFNGHIADAEDGDDAVAQILGLDPSVFDDELIRLHNETNADDNLPEWKATATPSQRRAIRRARDKGESFRSIANRLGLPYGHVMEVARNRRERHHIKNKYVRARARMRDALSWELKLLELGVGP